MALLGDFLDQGTAFALAVGIFVGLLTYLSAARLIGRSGLSKAKSPVECQFRNVFATMDEGRRQSLIGCHMEKYECGREEAMRRAVDERQRDANRW